MRGETATLVTGQFVEEEETSGAGEGGRCWKLVDGRRGIEQSRSVSQRSERVLGLFESVVAGLRMDGYGSHSWGSEDEGDGA